MSLDVQPADGRPEGHQLGPRPHALIHSQVRQRDDIAQDTPFLFDQLRFVGRQFDRAFQIGDFQIGLGWKDGQIKRRDNRLIRRRAGISGSTNRTATDRGRLTKAASQRAFKTARLLGNISLKKMIASNDAEGESRRRRVLRMSDRCCSQQAHTRREREIDNVDQQIPEQHGGQQSVGIGQAAIGRPLPSVSRFANAARSAARSENKAASLAEKKAERPINTAMAAEQKETIPTNACTMCHAYSSATVPRPIAKSNSDRAGTIIAAVVNE